MDAAMRKGVADRDRKATLMKGCMQRIRERERERMGVSREGRGERKGGRENLGAAADY